MQYQNKQIGTALLLFMGSVAFLNLILAFFIGYTLIWPVFIILILISFLFYSLNIKVNNDEVSWFFGPGFWKKTIKIDSIKSVKTIKTKWYYGLGIRYTPLGWLYTVSGTTAVQVELKSGSNINLGTNDSNNLIKAIQSGLQA